MSLLSPGGAAVSPVGPQLAPFKELPRRLDLQPHKPGLNLQPAPRRPLSLSPAPPPAVGGGAAAAFKSAPLATTALLAAGFVAGSQIGNALYKGLNPDDPGFNDYLRAWLGDPGVAEAPGRDGPAVEYSTPVESPAPFTGGQGDGVTYTVCTRMVGEGPDAFGNCNNPDESPSNRVCRSVVGPINSVKLVNAGSQGSASCGALSRWEVQIKAANGTFIGANRNYFDRYEPPSFAELTVSPQDGSGDPPPDLVNEPRSAGPITPGPTAGSAPSPFPLLPPPLTSATARPPANGGTAVGPLPGPEAKPAGSADPGPSFPALAMPAPSVAPSVAPAPSTKSIPGTAPAESSSLKCDPCTRALEGKVDKGFSDTLAKINALGTGAIAAAVAALADLINQIAAAVGVGAYPVTAPATINACETRPGKTLNNAPELALWQTEQLDALMGQWCTGIDIDTPEGNKRLDVDNLSDAIQEILGMLAAQSIGAGITQNAVVRNLVETGAVKQQAFLAHQYAKGNAEFLGYEGRRQKTNMPLTFTPGQGLLDGLLGSGNVPVQGWKKSDSRDLNDIFAELLQAAAIIRAVYWRRLDTSDMEGQIRDIVSRQSDFPDRVQQDQENQPEGDDWARYIEAVENAFQTDISNPYGKDPNQRPRIVDKPPPSNL